MVHKRSCKKYTLKEDKEIIELVQVGYNISEVGSKIYGFKS